MSRRAPFEGGLNGFKVVTSVGAVHDREITGGGKASVLNEEFEAVNTLIGNVKTALTGTYHAIKFAEYAYRDLVEVQLRFNRRYDLRAVLCGLLTALARAPRCPECGIRVAELPPQSSLTKAAASRCRRVCPTGWAVPAVARVVGMRESSDWQPENSMSVAH